MEKKISLQVGSNKQLMVGIGLIALGILMPVLLDIHRFGVYPMLDRALAEGEKTYPGRLGLLFKIKTALKIHRILRAA